MNDTLRGAGAWADDDLVTLAALQHHVYCPRQCALIHVEQVWTENLYTLRGARAHERVDEAGGATRDGVRTERALPLFSDVHGLVGKADVVEFSAGGVPYPVEHKVGPGKARRADEVQLCAQALCLEEMFGQAVPAGALFHKKTRRRREVAFTDALRAETLAVAAAVRATLQSGRLPPPVADARCERCSLVETCMPFVVARWDAPEPPDAPDP